MNLNADKTIMTVKIDGVDVPKLDLGFVGLMSEKIHSLAVLYANLWRRIGKRRNSLEYRADLRRRPKTNSNRLYDQPNR